MSPKFSTIFFANLSEISLDLVRYMTAHQADEEISEDHALCDRFTFSQDDNSILVTPNKLDGDFLKDNWSLLKINNIVNLSPKKVDESLCQSVQKDLQLYSFLKSTIRRNPKIKIIAYSATPQFFDLLDALTSEGLSFSAPEVPPAKARWTQEYFGSKAGFRKLATSLKNFPAMPEGKICLDKKTVFSSALKFLKTRPGCVIKANHGLAGAGLQIIKKEEAGKNPQKYVEKVLLKEKYFQYFPVVVEEYIPPNLSLCGGAPNIELCLKDGKITPLYVCGMRVSPNGVFNGVEIGRGAVPRQIESILVDSGKKFGRKLQTEGYQGYFEIDWVAGKDNKVHPIEANLRRTGGTHVYDLGKKLLGNSFPHFYLTANNHLPCPKLKHSTYKALKKKLSPALYPVNSQSQGVVLTIISSLSIGRLGYVVVGKNRDEAIAIENNLKNLLESA